MKKLTRKLFISILSMAFAVIAIGTTTFAWITISSTATIKPFEGTVEAGGAGIELSIDGTNWTSTIDIASLIGDVKFSDITTKDGINFNELSFSENTAVASACTIQAGTDATPANGSYISIRFYIRRSDWKSAPRDAADLSVYVDSSKVKFSTTSSGDYNTDVKVDDHVPGTVTSLVKGIQVDNAARLSIYAKNADDREEVIYYEKGAVDDNSKGTAYDGFAYKYWKAKLGDVTFPTDIKPNYSTYETESAGKSSKLVDLPIANVESDAMVEIILNVWVEGFDNECHANILNQTLKIELGLTI